MKDLSNQNIIHVKKCKVEYLQFRKLLEYGDVINHCFTLKHNDMDFSMHWDTEKYKPTVIKNYQRICESLGMDYKQIVRPWQTHTANVLKIRKKIKNDEPDVGLEELKDIDGVITNKKNIILSTTNADCILFLFFDPENKVIANVHSGWKGTFQKIVTVAVNKMISDYGCNPQNIICCASPSISKEMFCVHEDVEKPCREIFDYTGRENEFISIGEIEEACRTCKKCKLCMNRTNVVIGDGKKDADIMFIGEGPGADEDESGIPFVGKAGKLMNMALDGLGINREELYIANVVKCRPPGNRTPEDDEAAACLDYLRSQVMLVKPKIIVLLGNVALKNILGKEYGITSSRGKWVEKKGIMYMPTFHPAALLRDESKKIDFWNDLKEVKRKNKE